MHPSKRAQIAHLKADEAPTKVPSKYADFTNIFFPKLAAELLEHIKINDHTIELVDDHQPSSNPIYGLSLVELEMLKAYIQNNLANGFIKPSKSYAGALILSDKKPNGSLRLWVDYQGFNNLTIKNWYPLPLVRKSLDRLSWAQWFTQFNLTNTYYQIRIKKGNKWKTAFRTRYGYFKYQVISFEFINAPAIF